MLTVKNGVLPAVALLVFSVAYPLAAAANNTGTGTPRHLTEQPPKTPHKQNGAQPDRRHTANAAHCYWLPKIVNGTVSGLERKCSVK